MKEKVKYFSMFLIVLIFSNLRIIFPQEFMLSDISVENYSIDKIAQEVYFKDLFTDTVRKVNLKTMEITKTNFLTLSPNFGNKHHVLRYRTTFYNIDNQSYYTIPSSQSDSLGGLANSEFTGSFSPNDSNFFFPMFPKAYIFSLNDSSLKPININISIDYYTNGAWPQWSSDSSIIFISNSNSILEYLLKSKRIDTLVLLGQYEDISGFSYNKKYNIMAYSIYEDTPKIYFHYANKSIPDSIIFDPARDEPDVSCWQTPIALTSLSWSPDENNLAFFTFFETLSAAGIYDYNLDSNKIFHITDCATYGTKYYLHWTNDDTLIYNNTTLQRLFGFDISSVITSVDFFNNIIPSKEFIISSYPNPFNLSTRIKIKYNSYEPIRIKIYSILGKLIKSMTIVQGTNEVIWNATDNAGKIVTSGVYFISAESNKVRSNITKVVLIK